MPSVEENRILKSIESLLQTATNEIVTLRKEIRDERDERRTAIRWVWLALAISILVAGWNLKLDHDQCVNSNEARANIRASFALLTVELIPEDATPELIDRVNRFTENLNDILPEVECNWSPL